MSKLSEALLDPDNLSTIRDMKNAWRNTIAKCYNRNHHDFGYYGARGITVCDRWRQSFENFFEDMGLRPEDLTIERVDNDGNYEPGNCIWATRQDQSWNRRVMALVTWEGRTMSVAAWEREFGWRAGTLKARLNRLGYSLQDAFTKPVKPGQKLPNREYAPRRKPDMSKIPRGLQHPFTKLTAEDVIAMRQKHQQGATFSALAREYGVTTTTASGAVQGRGAYKDITC